MSERFQRKGLAPGEAAASALDFDLACMWFGRWVDQREKATKKAPRPKSASKKIDVPRYNTRAHMLGLVDGVADDNTGDHADVDALTDQFRKDPDALLDYLGET